MIDFLRNCLHWLIYGDQWIEMIPSENEDELEKQTPVVDEDGYVVASPFVQSGNQQV